MNYFKISVAAIEKYVIFVPLFKIFAKIQKSHFNGVGMPLKSGRKN